MSIERISPEYDAYLQLVREYQNSVSRCKSALDEVREAQQALRHAASSLKFGVEQIDEANKLEAQFNGLVGTQNDANGFRLDTLSPREREVFSALGNGLSSHEIAEKYHLAISTVETYRERLKTKLKLSSGNALARCAILWVAGHPDAFQAIDAQE